MIQRFLFLWLTLISLVAFYWTSWISESFDPFVSTKPILSYLIAVTMFAIGWMLPAKEIDQLRARWPLVILGTSLQYATMPTLAYLVARGMSLEGDYLIGVVMVGCVPGAMASNVLTLNAKGNVSYSVSLTTTATLLSPLIVPFVLRLALNGAEVSIDFWDVSRKLLITVVMPVVLGHLIGRRFPRWENASQKTGLLVANLSILWIIAVVVALNREPLSQFRLDLSIALLALNLLGYLAGYWGGRGMKLSPPMRRALTLEIGMQNAGLGATLATVLFVDRPEIAIAPAMYTFGCMMTGTILAKFWSTVPIEQPENSK